MKPRLAGIKGITPRITCRRKQAKPAEPVRCMRMLCSTLLTQRLSVLRWSSEPCPFGREQARKRGARRCRSAHDNTEQSSRLMPRTSELGIALFPPVSPHVVRIALELNATHDMNLDRFNIDTQRGISKIRIVSAPCTTGECCEIRPLVLVADTLR